MLLDDGITLCFPILTKEDFSMLKSTQKNNELGDNSPTSIPFSWLNWFEPATLPDFVNCSA